MTARPGDVHRQTCSLTTRAGREVPDEKGASRSTCSRWMADAGRARLQKDPPTRRLNACHDLVGPPTFSIR